jgi:hypothetical protein
MRSRRVVWLLALVALLGAVWAFDVFDILRGWLYQLASHPDTADAFDDYLAGRTDALLMLVSVFLLTPIVLGLVLLALVFVLVVVLAAAEPVLRLMRLPLWVCVPVLLVGLAVAAYVVRAMWFPQLAYFAGLGAKAWIVFFSTSPPIPH